MSSFLLIDLLSFPFFACCSTSGSGIGAELQHVRVRRRTSIFDRLAWVCELKTCTPTCWERAAQQGGGTLIPSRTTGSGVPDQDAISPCDQPRRRHIRKRFAHQPPHMTLYNMMIGEPWSGSSCMYAVIIWKMQRGCITHSVDVKMIFWFFFSFVFCLFSSLEHHLPSWKSRNKLWAAFVSFQWFRHSKVCSGYVCYPATSVWVSLPLKSKANIWVIKNGCITSGGCGLGGKKKSMAQQWNMFSVDASMTSGKSQSAAICWTH